MSTFTCSLVRSASERPSREHRLLVGGQTLLAAFFGFAALPKLAGSHSELRMFDRIGTRQWLRYFVGPAGLAGAIGLLVPHSTRFAAAGLTVDLAGATAVNTAVLHSPAVAMTLPPCVTFALIARAHSREHGRAR
jgi:putative oxidoreductase